MNTLTWKHLPQPDADTVGQLSAALAHGDQVFPRALATILLQRQISTFEAARTFFAPDRSACHSPWQMRDMDQAVARMLAARTAHEHILLLGDYDVDGTTAVALMTLCLREMGFHTSYYIPDRYAEGYGVSYQGIDHAAAQGARLMITLDCGIKDVEKIRYASVKGVDVIVCDHHTPGPVIPAACAVLDPKRPDCAYPYKELTGCGVGLKLLEALAERLRPDLPPGFDPLTAFADLITLSIACDIVPITGENRIMAHIGLEKLRTAPLPGIAALMAQSTESRSWDISDLVFFIGPRINAAGRLAHGSGAVEVLLGQTTALAALAQELEDANNARKELDKQITEEALHQIAADPDFGGRSATVLYDPAWHKGIIGIVASRVIEHHHRPTVMLTQTEGKLVGSARSVPGFDLYHALEACAEHLTQFGGHTYAAGLTLHPSQLEAFRQKFYAVAADLMTPELRQPVLTIDTMVTFEEVTDRMVRILDRMEPFGPQNRRPVLAAADVRVTYATILKEEHIRLTLEQHGVTHTAIGFNLARKWHDLDTTRLDIAFQPVFNTWNNQSRINLRLKDIQPSHA